MSFDKTMIFPREYPFYGKWIYFDISVLIFFFFSIMYFRSWFPRNSLQKQPPEVLKKTVLKTSQYSQLQFHCSKGVSLQILRNLSTSTLKYILRTAASTNREMHKILSIKLAILRFFDRSTLWNSNYDAKISGYIINITIEL